GLNLYPNPAPAGSQIVLQMKNMTTGNYKVKVYSATGQLLSTQSIVGNNGSISQTLSLNNWQKGIYVLEISGPVKLQKQFIIQ
ncbi:MAG: T9SS type A sorting domain-containing protein, partial [Flavisolibacter sp.]